MMMTMMKGLVWEYPLVVLASLVTFGAAVVVLLRGSLLWRRRRLHPVAGTVFHRLLNFHRLYDFHVELSRKHKTFRLVGPLHSEVFTSDPVVVEYILKSNFHNYGKGWHTDKMKDLFGEGIFVEDGQKWRHQRKLASYEFSTKVLRDFSSVVFKSNAAKLANVVSRAADCNQEMDFQDLFMKSTLDSIFRVGFGIELDTLNMSAKGSAFARAFDDSCKLIMLRHVNLFWKIFRFFNVSWEARLKKNVKEIDDFIYEIIRIKMENRKTNGHDLAKKDDILSRFLIEMEKDPENMNSRYLRDVVLNFVLAGKDTTAATLSWFFSLVCKYPKVQDKIVSEIREVIDVSDESGFDEFSMAISEGVLDKLHYLHATLSETLRLHPVVPLDAKVCFSDDVLPDGFDVRKNDIIVYQPIAMGRMESLWGSDAEVFRPERWLNEDGVYCSVSPFKFTAFQAGPRVCLGKDFAYRQMKIFAAVLLRFFEFKLSDENKPIKYRPMLTMQIDQGLFLRATRRIKT